MEKHRFIIVFGGISILTILVVFLSCCYFSQIKNEQILKATYLFSHAVDLEKELMQPEFISFPRSDTGISSDSTVIETEKGANIKTTIRVAFEEAIFGTQKELDLPLKDECEVCKGTGSQPGHQPEVCGKCGGKGQIVTTQQSLFGVVRNVSTCPDCGGSGKIIRYKCSNCAGTGYVKSRKKIQIAVPPGVDNGTNIRIKGKGEPGFNGGERGDLHVTILVDRHPKFQRQEYNLYSSEPISFTQAALGGNIKIHTIEGEIDYTIPPGTQTDTKVKLKGKGVPNLKNPTQRGDHYVTLVVQVPEKLTAEQKRILNEYEQATLVETRPATDSVGTSFSFGDHKKRKKK